MEIYLYLTTSIGSGNRHEFKCNAFDEPGVGEQQSSNLELWGRLTLACEHTTPANILSRLADEEEWKVQMGADRNFKCPFGTRLPTSCCA